MPRERAHVRYETRLRAMLATPDLTLVLDCLLLDISQGGALVGLRQAGPIEGKMYLWQSMTGSILECLVRWQRLNLVGLEFNPINNARELSALVQACATAVPSVKAAARNWPWWMEHATIEGLETIRSDRRFNRASVRRRSRTPTPATDPA